MSSNRIFFARNQIKRLSFFHIVLHHHLSRPRFLFLESPFSSNIACFLYWQMRLKERMKEREARKKNPSLFLRLVLSLHNRHSFFRFFASESNIMTFFLTNLLWRGNNDRFPSSSPRFFDISNDKILLQTLFPRIVCIVNKEIISSIVVNPLIRERKTEQLN